MKAKELMIGDWVNFGSFTRQVIQSDYYQDVNGDCVLAGVKPILLTAEILEKNGWKKEFDKKPYMTFYHLEDEKYWLMWCISEHTLDIQRQNKTLLEQCNLCAERVVIACNYVHQLQHALRLCGIDKEIVL